MKLFNKALILTATIFPFTAKANIPTIQEEQNRRVMEILYELFSKDSIQVYEIAYMTKPQLEEMLSESLTENQYIQLIKLIRIFAEANINFQIKKSDNVILATQDFKAEK